VGQDESIDEPAELADTSHAEVLADTSHAEVLADTSHAEVLADTSHADITVGLGDYDLGFDGEIEIGGDMHIDEIVDPVSMIRRFSTNFCYFFMINWQKHMDKFFNC